MLMKTGDYGTLGIGLEALYDDTFYVHGGEAAMDRRDLSTGALEDRYPNGRGASIGVAPETLPPFFYGEGSSN